MAQPSPGLPRSSARLSWSATDGERVVELDESLPAVTIGRSSSAEVRLDDKRVSRLHAQLAWNGHVWIVRDLDSHNGTRVGSVPVGAGLPLAHGDVLRCGHVALTFSWPAGAPRDPRSSQAETLTGSLLPPVTAAEMSLLQELCRPYRQGEDPRTSATAPTPNAQIAERLRLSESAVRQRLKRLYPKLGLSGAEREKRRELAAQAIELGIVRPGA